MRMRINKISKLLGIEVTISKTCCNLKIILLSQISNLLTNQVKLAPKNNNNSNIKKKKNKNQVGTLNRENQEKESLHKKHLRNISLKCKIYWQLMLQIWNSSNKQ